MPSATLRALLTELIDYAGLFPPAALPLTDVVSNYRAYRGSADGWALGRLIVPVTRLGELTEAVSMLDAGENEVWPVSALISEDAERDAETIIAWNAAHAGRLVIDTAEARISAIDAVAATARALGNTITLYAEIPLADVVRFVDAIAQAGARAKIRTGGVTTDAFPRSEDVSRFLLACAGGDVAFKATAGLHHPVRGDYRLSYDEDATCGAMFGFLNLFLTAAFAREGMSQRLLVALLEEREPTALRFANAAVTWREHSISIDAIAETRRTFAIAFGSCSFREPIDDLHQLELL